MEIGVVANCLLAPPLKVKGATGWTQVMPAEFLILCSLCYPHLVRKRDRKQDGDNQNMLGKEKTCVGFEKFDKLFWTVEHDWL